jgi:hypothetical protein
MQKYTDVVTSARSGAAIPDALVTVKTSPAGATATIYSDDGVTTQSNPLTTDSNGEFTFYAADGEYTLTVSGTGITERTVGPIILHDPADEDEYMPSTDVSFTPSGSGAVARTVDAKLKDYWISVKDFGAVGDGSTDDTSAINLALAYAQTLTRKRVFFPPGIYKCTSALTAITGGSWSFIGSGRGVSTLWQTADTGVLRIDVSAADSEIGQVKDMTLRGPSSGAYSNCAGVHVIASTSSATGLKYWTFDCDTQDVYRGVYLEETGMSTFAGIAQNGEHDYLTFINFETLAGSQTTFNGVEWEGASGVHHVFLGGRIRGSNRSVLVGKDQDLCGVGDTIAIGTHFLGGEICVELIAGSNASTYGENWQAIGCQFECTVAPFKLTRMNNCRFDLRNGATLLPIFVDCDEDSIAWDSMGSKSTLPGVQPIQNFLHNGSHQIWQRGTSFVPGVTISMADRWRGRRSANAAGSTYSRQAGFSNAQYCMRIQRDSGNSATDALFYGQQIPSAEGLPMAGRRVAISADVRTGADYSGGTLTVNFFTGTGTDEVLNLASGFATGNTNTSPGAKSISTTAQRIRWLSVELPSTATEFGIAFLWTPTGTAGAADYVEITNVKVEISAVATRFIPKPFTEELENCRRFYQKSFDYATTPAQNAGANTGETTFVATVAGANTNRSHRIQFNPVLRATTGTAITFYNPAAANAQARDKTSAADCTNTTAVNTTESGFHITVTANAGTAVGEEIGVHWTADAEID